MAERLIAPAVLLGLGLGLWQALGGPLPGARLDPELAALVNDQAIPASEWRRAVEAIARDKRSALSAADEARALDNLISEELLLQQAQAIGLMESDRGVRKAVIDAMLQFIRAGAQSRSPDEAALRDLYAAQPELGQRPPRYRLAHAQISDDPQAAVAALQAGEAFELVFAEALTRSPLPEAWLTPRGLSSYLPPSLIEALAVARPGDILGPISLEGQHHFLWVQAHEPGERGRFADLRPQLEALWHRQAAEQAVADYLQGLREQAQIRRATTLAATR